jgi:DNA-binding transcriptional LysR family regulator
VIGDADPLVERLPIDLPLPPLPVWLAAPEVLRSNPRIKRIFDLLADALKPLMT